MKFKWLVRAIALMAVVQLVGCSSSPSKVYSTSKSTPKIKPLKHAVNLADSKLVRNKVLSQYRLWKGTPYRYGGTSRKGVDCSAFVQNTFRNKLGYAIPRTTRTQIRKGYSVSKSRLKPGDVVFFKTGRNSLHNGIYIGDSKFVHASSSKGVIISSLDNRYWQSTYYTSKRMR